MWVISLSAPSLNSLNKRVQMIMWANTWIFLIAGARKGQCFHQPCMGTREFIAHFALIENDEKPASELTHLKKQRLGLDVA